jgi:hypothetical protein
MPFSDSRDSGVLAPRPECLPAAPARRAEHAATPPREFRFAVPARLIKDPHLSPAAKLLRVILAAYADARTGRAHVALKTIERLMRCSRTRRERAQRELVAAGWLQLERERMGRGLLGRRIFLLCEPPALTTASFHHSGGEQHSLRQSP